MKGRNTCPHKNANSLLNQVLDSVAHHLFVHTRTKEKETTPYALTYLTKGKPLASSTANESWKALTKALNWIDDPLWFVANSLLTLLNIKVNHHQKHNSRGAISQRCYRSTKLADNRIHVVPKSLVLVIFLFDHTEILKFDLKPKILTPKKKKL